MFNNSTMKKQILTFAALLAATSAFAGGYITNTNQSISFLRQPAQNAVISVNGAYYNPAGVGFLPNGWQISFGMQNIHQTREITSTFAPFALGADNNGQATKKFKGTTLVPVLPSLDLTYVHDKIFGSFHFGIIGGGGAADFKNGLGSFESSIAMIPAVFNKVAQKNLLGYDADINMLGKQYFIASQLNFGYRINDNLSVSAGIRGYYIYSHYEAAIRNIQLSYGGSLAPAATVLSQLLTGMGMNVPASTLESVFADKELNCNQTDFTAVPILGVDYKTGRFNFAAKYEFNTSIRLKNDTKVNSTGISQYDNGKSGMANDMGAMLAAGAQYEILDGFRANVGFNWYFDKQSKMYNSATGKNDKTDLIGSNPFEVLAGLEYDIDNKFTVSGGAQITRFDWGKDKAFLSDMSYSISSWSPAFGFRYNYNDHLSFDFAGFITLNIFFKFRKHHSHTINKIQWLLGSSSLH